MEKLVVEGLCVSHSIVLENQENITKQLCQQYLGEEIVCPRNFEKWLFTVAVIDNKDHGPSSPKIKYSFQGTSISVCQRKKSNLSHRRFAFENTHEFFLSYFSWVLNKKYEFREILVLKDTLCEKCLNKEFSLACIFLCSDWIQRYR